MRACVHVGVIEQKSQKRRQREKKRKAKAKAQKQDGDTAVQLETKEREDGESADLVGVEAKEESRSRSPEGVEDDADDAAERGVAVNGKIEGAWDGHWPSKCEVLKAVKYQNVGAKIVDLGNACYTYKHFTDDIQVRVV